MGGHGVADLLCVLRTQRGVGGVDGLCGELAAGVRCEWSAQVLHVHGGVVVQADAVVFATPVYWFSVSARMKALLERMTSMENQGLLNLGKPMVLLAVAEEEGASQALSQMLLPLSYMGFVLAPLGLVYAHHRGAVSLKGNTELMEDARIAGENLVLMAEKLRGTAFREPLPSYQYRLPRLPGVAAD